MRKTIQLCTNPTVLYRWLLTVLLGFCSVFYPSVGMATSQSVERVILDFQINGNTVVTDALGKQKTYTFDTLNHSIKPLSITETYTDLGQAKSVVTTYTYTSTGQVDTLKDANGRIMDYDYNERGLLTQRIEAKATPDERTTTIDWHPQHRVPTRIIVPGRITDYEYNSCSTGQSFHLCQITLTDDGAYSGESRIWTYTYTTAADNTVTGLIKTIDGPHTNKPDLITYGYYTLDHAWKGRVKTITNGLNQVTTITAYDGNGRPKTIVDANQNTTALTYDLRGRLKKRTIGTSTTNYDYRPDGSLEKVTQGSGDYIKYGYDGAQRLVSIEDNLGHKIVYTLDAMGNRLQEDYIDPQGMIRKTSQGEYNELSRMTLQSDGENHYQRLAYNAMGNLVAESDPRKTVGTDLTNIRSLDPLKLDNSTLHDFDPLNRLIQSIHIRLESNNADDVVTKYGYNALDQLVSVLDPKGLSTHYQINALGDLKKQISPDTGTANIVFDAAGNPKTQTDARDAARGQTISYQHDALNRLTHFNYQDDTLDIRFNYDEPSSSNSIGQISSMQDGSGTTSFHYDARGNRIQVTTNRDSLSHTIGYQYNDSDQITQITYPSGRKVDYQRAANGQITTITETHQGTSNTLVSNIQYLPFGPISSLSYGNGIASTSAYGLNYLIKTLDSSPALSLTFSYDAAGNITTLDDQLNRLGDGQDLNDHNVEYRYGTESHHLLNSMGSENQVFTYDENGNMLSKGNHSFVYGDHNRLVEAKVNGLVVGSYTYNGQGERVKKVANAEVIYFHYDQASQLIAESNSIGQVIKEYTYLNGQLLSIWQPENGTTNTYYVHNNHLGTPKAITDAGQNIVWEGLTTPFGQVVNSTGTIINNVRFPGQYFDNETGLHYNYFRYYDPTIGRYITSDPIGLAGGLNTYAYVGGNPLRYSDPKGLFFWDVLDLGFFAQSLYQYSQCSSSDNAINLGLDAIGLLPGIPALGTLRKVDEAVDVVKKGTTVIGHLSNTPGVAKKIGANYLKPSKDWSFQKQGEFIKEVISRGDDVLIGTSIRQGSSVLKREIKQLVKQGYKPKQQGSKWLTKE